MALLTLSRAELDLEYDCVLLLPDLEEAVYFEDSMIVGMEDAYVEGMDDWWDGFVSDMYL